MAKYAVGNEPENVKKRITILFAKLDEAYPDKVIIGLAGDHKKWDETAREISKQLGYDSKNDFLIAYGYKIESKSAGRTKAVFSEDIIAELQRRYPNGSEFSSIDDLFAANPEFLPKLKTIKNTATETFGMPLGKYLRSLGLLCTETKEKVKKEVDYVAALEEFAEELKRRLAYESTIPESIESLMSSFFDMNFSKAKKCVKRIYNGEKTLDQYLRENGILREPEDEKTQMQRCIDVLKERYESHPAPTKVSTLIAENPDLPIRKLNKYIIEIIGEPDAETFYIKNGIMQDKEGPLVADRISFKKPENYMRFLSAGGDLERSIFLRWLESTIYYNSLGRPDELPCAEYDEQTNEILYCYKITRVGEFSGSNDRIKKIQPGDKILVDRDKERYSHLIVKNDCGEPIGFVDGEANAALNPLIRRGEIKIVGIFADQVILLSQRKKTCTNEILYYKMKIKIVGSVIKRLISLSNRIKTSETYNYNRDRCIERIKEFFQSENIKNVSCALTTDDCYLLFVIGGQQINPWIPFWEHGLFGKNYLNNAFEEAIFEATGEHMTVIHATNYWGG